MAEKHALVISGGGAKGAFGVGALKYLMVDLRLRFDLVIGTSTGALIAPLVATRDLADLLNIYENVEDQHVLRDRPDLLAFLFSDALNSSEPLRRMIGRYLGDPVRYQKLVGSPTELFVTILNMQTGLVEYGNPRRVPQDVFLRQVLASASIPILMPPVRIGPFQYVDGGVKETAPFARAIEEGATHVIAIVLSPPPETRQPQREFYTNLLEITRRTLTLLTEEVIDNDVLIARAINEGVITLAQIRANAAALGLGPAAINRLFAGIENPFGGRRVIRLTIIRPQQSLGPETLSFNPVQMRRWVDQGYRRAREVWEGGSV